VKRSDVQQLIAIIDQAYNRRSWHGTNLRGSIRGLSAPHAAWRPADGRHNIWELVIHARTGSTTSGAVSPAKRARAFR
jgi:hypothetical protein